MSNHSQINQITLPKTILKEQGIAILDLKLYERLQNKIKELKEELKKQKELKGVKAIIAEGDEDYRNGRTTEMRQFLKKDYPKLYAKHFR